MSTTSKLYLVTRSDLPQGQQAVQAAHALQEFNVKHPEESRLWYEASNTLALLAVENEEALHFLVARAVREGIEHAPFREPDRGDELTAVAMGPGARRLCSRIPLALR